MITLYGMSDKFGMVGLERVESQYLGSNRVLECSDATAEEVDLEIRLMIREQHDRATALLKENESLLREVSEYLMEHETITGDTFRALIEKHQNPEEPPVEPEESLVTAEETDKAPVENQE